MYDSCGGCPVVVDSTNVRSAGTVLLYMVAGTAEEEVLGGDERVVLVKGRVVMLSPFVIRGLCFVDSLHSEFRTQKAQRASTSVVVE